MNDNAVKKCALPKWGDAIIKTARYNPEADPQLHEPITVTIGAGRDSNAWTPKPMPLGQFLAQLCTHREGKKDGLAVVLADMVPGSRKGVSVKSLTAVGLDLDTGMSGEEIDRRLADLGVLAVRYTTHSHLKAETVVTKDAVVRWVAKERNDDGDVEDPEVLREFLASKNYDPEIAQSAEFGGIDHTGQGIMLKITHRPMPKHRLVLPLAAPFDIAAEGATQREAMDKWKKVPKAVAAALGGLPLDKTGVDPSRLFYLPRHDKGAPFEVSLFGGPRLDWRTLQLDDPWEALAGEMNQGKSKSTTDEGRALGRWSIKAAHGFQIVEAIKDHCPEKIRHDGGLKVEIECPFDDHHSNPGDPDDRACMAVNAGDGPAEMFVVSCRHESCLDRTMLDHLGKMLGDEWFPRSALEDEAYNALATEDAPMPEVAQRIEREDKAAKAAPGLVDALTLDSPAVDVTAAARAVLAAKPGEQAVLKLRLKKKIKATDAVMKELFASLRREATPPPNKPAQRAGERVVFPFQGNKPDHAETIEAIFQVLAVANKPRGVPTPRWTCLESSLVFLNEHGARPRFEEINAGRFAGELADLFLIQYVGEPPGGKERVAKEVSDSAYYTAYKRLPRTPEIARIPVFAADGRLISSNGWYVDDALYLQTALTIPAIPKAPTGEQVEEAVALFRDDVLVDFPFQDRVDGSDTREPSFANTLAMILTPFMRRLFNGPSPAFVINKPVTGTGGTFLARVPVTIFDGTAVGAEVKYTDDPDELSKKLLSAALTGRSHFLFDDVKNFNNPALLQPLTSAEITDRELGGNRIASVINQFNWIATGNNPPMSDEMARRCCFINLNAPVIAARKFKRSEAEYQDWLIAERGRIVGAALTLVSAWIAAGRPAFDTTGKASFDSWARAVGGVLACAGVPGFLTNPRRAGADSSEAAVCDFINQWHRRHNVDEVNRAALFTLATDTGSDLIEGNPEWTTTKRAFFLRLDRMENRTFHVGDQTLAVRICLGDDGAQAYRLEPVQRQGAGVDG